MASGTRLVIFNLDEEYAPNLRAELLGIDGVKIVAEVDELGLLPSAIDQFACDVVIVHLDPHPEAVLQVAGQVARERSDLPFFGISASTDGQLILEALRAGFREFILRPPGSALDVEQLSQAMNRVAQQRPQTAKTGKLVAVIGTVGGVGATTVATNLAVELAANDSCRVALVDMDFRFGQIATFLDVQPNFTIAELCETPEQCDQSMLEKALVKHPSGVHVLARPNHFAQAEQLSAAHCGGILSALQELYDYIVVDGPNRYDNGGKAVLDMADVNLLVVQLLVTSIRSTDRILTELGRAGYNLERIKLICNQVGRESGHLSVEHIETTLDTTVFQSIVDDWKTISGAINMGEPLLTHASKSKIRHCYQELASKIHSPAGGESGNGAEQKKSGGLFSKIFSE